MSDQPLNSFLLSSLPRTINPTYKRPKRAWIGVVKVASVTIPADTGNAEKMAPDDVLEASQEKVGVMTRGSRSLALCVHRRKEIPSEGYTWNYMVSEESQIGKVNLMGKRAEPEWEPELQVKNQVWLDLGADRDSSQRLILIDKNQCSGLTQKVRESKLSGVIDLNRGFKLQVSHQYLVYSISYSSHQRAQSLCCLRFGRYEIFVPSAKPKDIVLCMLNSSRFGSRETKYAVKDMRLPMEELLLIILNFMEQKWDQIVWNIISEGDNNEQSRFQGLKIVFRLVQEKLTWWEVFEKLIITPVLVCLNTRPKDFENNPIPEKCENDSLNIEIQRMVQIADWGLQYTNELRLLKSKLQEHIEKRDLSPPSEALTCQTRTANNSETGFPLRRVQSTASISTNSSEQQSPSSVKLVRKGSGLWGTPRLLTVEEMKQLAAEQRQKLAEQQRESSSPECPSEAGAGGQEESIEQLVGRLFFRKKEFKTQLPMLLHFQSEMLLWGPFVEFLRQQVRQSWWADHTRTCLLRDRVSQDLLTLDRVLRNTVSAIQTSTADLAQLSHGQILNTTPRFPYCRIRSLDGNHNLLADSAPANKGFRLLTFFDNRIFVVAKGTDNSIRICTLDKQSALTPIAEYPTNRIDWETPFFVCANNRIVEITMAHGIQNFLLLIDLKPFTDSSGPVSFHRVDNPPDIAFKYFRSGYTNFAVGNSDKYLWILFYAKELLKLARYQYQENCSLSSALVTEVNRMLTPNDWSAFFAVPDMHQKQIFAIDRDSQLLISSLSHSPPTSTISELTASLCLTLLGLDVHHSPISAKSQTFKIESPLCSGNCSLSGPCNHLTLLQCPNAAIPCFLFASTLQFVSVFIVYKENIHKFERVFGSVIKKAIFCTGEIQIVQNDGIQANKICLCFSRRRNLHNRDIKYSLFRLTLRLC